MAVKDQISELIVMSQKSKSIGAVDGAFVYCRQAMECMLEDQFVLYYDEKPEPPKHGGSRFFWTCKKLKSKINKLSFHNFLDLNRLSRQGAHFTSEQLLSSDEALKEALILVKNLYQRLYPNEPIEFNLIVNETNVRQRVLQNEASEIMVMSLEDSITDEQEIILDGYSEIALLALSQGENLPLKERASLGIALYHRGSLGEAETILLEALEQNAHIENSKIHGLCYSGLGRISRQRGESDNAIGYYEKSITCHINSTDREGEMFALCGLGDVYRKNGNIEEASLYFGEARVIANELDHKQGLATVLSSFADLERNQGNLEVSWELYKKSLKISEEINYTQRIASNSGGLAEIERRRGNIKIAKKSLEKNLLFTQKHRYRRGESINLSELGKISRHLKEFEKAKQYYGMTLLGKCMTKR